MRKERYRLIVGAFLVLTLAGGTRIHASFYPDPENVEVFVTVMPFVQRWYDDLQDELMEIGLPVFVSVPVGPETGISIRTGTAIVNGGWTPDLTGLTDIQVGLSHALRKNQLVGYVGVNLPSGRRDFSTEDYETVCRMSMNQYDFRLPVYGQGFNVAMGINWVMPLSNFFVLGLGGGLQYKGPYKPVEEMQGKYHPGSEIILTGGFDWQMYQTATLSGNVGFCFYQADQVGESRVFQAGNQTTAGLRFLQKVNFHELRILVDYLGRGKNSVAIGGALFSEAERSTPRQWDVEIGLMASIYTGVMNLFFAEMRHFEQTPGFPGLATWGIGLAPEFRLNKQVNLHFRFKYFFGQYLQDDTIDIVGQEFSAGITAGL